MSNLKQNFAVPPTDSSSQQQSLLKWANEQYFTGYSNINLINESETASSSCDKFYANTNQCLRWSVFKNLLFNWRDMRDKAIAWWQRNSRKSEAIDKFKNIDNVDSELHNFPCGHTQWQGTQQLAHQHQMDLQNQIQNETYDINTTSNSSDNQTRTDQHNLNQQQYQNITTIPVVSESDSDFTLPSLWRRYSHCKLVLYVVAIKGGRNFHHTFFPPRLNLNMDIEQRITIGRKSNHYLKRYSPACAVYFVNQEVLDEIRRLKQSGFWYAQELYENHNDSVSYYQTVQAQGSPIKFYDYNVEVVPDPLPYPETTRTAYTLKIQGPRLFPNALRSMVIDTKTEWSDVIEAFFNAEAKK